MSVGRLWGNDLSVFWREDIALFDTAWLDFGLYSIYTHILIYET